MESLSKGPQPRARTNRVLKMLESMFGARPKPRMEFLSIPPTTQRLLPLWTRICYNICYSLHLKRELIHYKSYEPSPKVIVVRFRTFRLYVIYSVGNDKLLFFPTLLTGIVSLDQWLLNCFPWCLAHARKWLINEVLRPYMGIFVCLDNCSLSGMEKT